MKSVNLSILVVNCKHYIPSYNWYFNKGGRHICGTANSADDICFDEARLKEFNDSSDYVLLPECPGMTDDEAAEVVKAWCECNEIPYRDDMDNIEETYRWYYKYDDNIIMDNQESLYIWNRREKC